MTGHEDTERSERPAFELTSVIIPVFNEAEHLPSQLAALEGQTYEGAWEVVVADNGSTDGSDDIARSWADRLPDLRVVYGSDKQGCGYARNVGARAARGDFIVVCDADDVVGPGWLEAMVEAGRLYDVVGGRLETSTLNSPSVESWRPPQGVDGLPSPIGFLPHAPGGNCGVRTEVFHDLGGWREDLESGDDVDFSWRAHLASYRLGYAPDAVVHYRFRDDPWVTARQAFHYGLVQPLLYREYRSSGMARSSIGYALRSWARVIKHIGAMIRSGEDKGLWLRKAGLRAGRLVGSLRYRTLYL